MPDSDKGVEALSLARWLIASGPTAQANELVEVGKRLEEYLERPPPRRDIEMAREAVYEASGVMQDALVVLERLLQT